MEKFIGGFFMPTLSVHKYMYKLNVQIAGLRE
jgi:hypothetical protein